MLPTKRPRWVGRLLLGLTALVLPVQALPAEIAPVPFDVIVNGSRGGTWVFVTVDGALFAPKDALVEWRLLLDPETPTVSFRGQDYLPLDAIPGYTSRINPADQSLELLFSPQAFAATRLGRSMIRTPVRSPVLPSVFLNYDLNYAVLNPRDAPSAQDLGALTELGFSTSLGVLTTSIIGRNLTDDRTLGRQREVRRLETTFTRDLPDRNRTLRIGDAYTRMGMSGRNLYFGGVQFGTNYALTPGFANQPIPVVSGLSATPSTVELYVNDVLRQVSSIPTGPFAIENFPTLSGRGNARLVIRDQLGRETVIEQSFIVDSQLLAGGLDDWSVELGAVRQDLGESSGDYGPRFASGIWRRGVSDRLTLEGRGEFTRELNNVQVGAVAALPFMLLGRAAASTSRHDVAGGGQHWLLGVEYSQLRTSAQFEIQGASEDYRTLGQGATVRPTRRQVAGSWSYASERAGSFGIAYARINRFGEPSLKTMSANYGKRLGRNSYLSATGSRAVGQMGGSNAIALNLMVPFSANRVATAYAGSRGGRNDSYLTMTRNPSFDNRFGWRVLAGQQQDQGRVEAGTYFDGRFGTVTSDVSRSDELSAMRLGMTSGVVLADGQLFATRRVDSSFAVVEVAGYEGIGVGLGSNVTGRTNRQGVALVPSLSPYQRNSIQIDPRELPISAGIDSIEEVVVPAYRSAVKVSFPVRSGRGAMLNIVFDDGDVAPVGAIIRIEGDHEEFYVARRGLAFATGLQRLNRVVLTWRGQECAFDVLVPDTPADMEEIPRIGPLLCEGVAR